MSSKLVRFWLWGVAAVSIVIAIILFLSRQNRETHFTASVQTKSLAFTVGDWSDSAGLFVQGRAPVDLTIQSPCNLFSASTQEKLGKAGRGQTFRDVVLMSMDVSKGVRVEIDVEDGILIFNLERSSQQQGKSKAEGASPLAPLRFELTDYSPTLLPNHPPREQLELKPRDDLHHLEFSMRFRANPEPELNIPLQPGSTVSFEKEGVSQLLPGKAVLLLREPNRTRRGDFGLSAERLQNGALEQITLQPTPTGSFPLPADRTGQEYGSHGNDAAPLQVGFLSVRLSGIAKDIFVQDVAGARRENVALTWLQKRGTNLSSRVQAIGGILSVLVSILTLIFERRHQRDQNENLVERIRFL